jgi:cytoskeleton protein RodZ
LVMPEGPAVRTVGARLREAREKRGVSLRQLANSTRISVMSLEALEQSDLSRLPGGIFTRSFIRAYALEVGLDPERTIQDFIAELPPEAATATAHSVAVEDSEKLDSDRKAFATAARLVLLSVPLIALAIYYDSHPLPAARQGGAAAPAKSPAAASEQTRAEPAAPAVSVPATTAATPSAAEETSGLRMEIAPRAPCWVSVTVDAEPTFSGLMSPGDTRLFTARSQIRVHVGDAGAFAYTLNGHAGRPLGGPGEVISTQITLSNANEFSIP